MNKDRLADPEAFGKRVRECRKARGMSQEDLGSASDQSQSNIEWIERGGPKDPRKQALALAEALQTTPDWLLYEEGPRDTGPVVLSPQQAAESYAQLSFAEQQEVSELLSNRLAKKKKARKSA